MRLRHPDPAGQLLACAIASAICLLLLLTPHASAAPVIRVAGPDLVDATGKPVQLRGVNRSGTEFAGSVELVTGLRRNGRTTVRRARLSIPLYVCA